jgi:hypothetical protein
LDDAIAQDQDHHIRHEAVEVAESKFPFATDEAAAIFYAALKEVQAAEIIPLNLGVAEAEWDGHFYPETEVVKIGRKEVEITLPFRVWWPRAVAWAQGLELMVKIQAIETGDIP